MNDRELKALLDSMDDDPDGSRALGIAAVIGGSLGVLIAGELGSHYPFTWGVATFVALLVLFAFMEVQANKEKAARLRKPEPDREL